eukprot:7556531-Prorocentrum_lima.AAC.1
MDVQDPGLAAQLTGVFRTVVLVGIVHQDSTDTKSAVHHFGPRAKNPSKHSVQTEDHLGLHYAARKGQ